MAQMAANKKKVLMVCLGNICRSPIAEAVFQKTIKNMNMDDKWEVDSAAIGPWHIGRSPDYRALNVLKNNGITYTNKARQIEKKDFQDFDYIFGMDDENISDLKSIAPKNCHAKILLLGDFGLPHEDRIIRDPYYDSGSEGFEKAYKQCLVACKAFIEKVNEGNSCRSPMAETILKHIVALKKSEISLNWDIDSAALRSWNIGYPPEDRCLQVLSEHGLKSDHIGKEIKSSDFNYYDYIFGMDHGNIDELNQLAPKDHHTKIELLGNYYSKNDKIILDPYFENGIYGFQRCYEQIEDSCKNFVDLQIKKIKETSL